MWACLFVGELPVAAASNAETNFVEKLNLVLQKGSISEALSLFDTIPENLRNDVDLRTLHGSLLLSAGKTGEAEKIASDLLAKNSKNVDVLLLNSMVAKQRNNVAKKLQFLKQIVELEPNNPDANIELGNDNATKRKYKNARDYYLKAMNGDPNNIEALFGHAKMSYYLHRDDDSKKSFNRILELDPSNAAAYSYLAKFEAEIRHFKRATEYLQKAISIEPDNSDYYLDLGNYYREMGRLDETETAWKKATSLDPDYFLGYAYLAGLYDEQNKFDLAYDNYWKVVQKNPSYYYAYESLGMIAWHNGKYEDSIKFFGSAYKANPNNVSYALMVAANYQKMKKNQDCKAFTEKAMKGLNKNSLEYLSLRLFHDMTGESTLTLKIQGEEKKKIKGKYLFYLATYWDLKGKLDLAHRYYSEITEIQGADFFEYRLAEWAQSPAK
jgi:tetratricopeptide (TPR) repeat protein